MTDPLTPLGAALADRYRIERELGEGGMATVYLAHDLKHDRDVAIKVLKPELAAVLGAERFVQEIATTAHLQHPNILPLFDSGRAVVPPSGERESTAGDEGWSGAESFLYYVMPYVEGESLRTKLDRERQLGVDESVRLVSEVADALQYAHDQGVVHRDIKPENILIHAGRAIVADFGIALAVSAAAGGRMTETGLSLGTPHYMSPEQATAEKDITGRSDIYSLGSVLYEMLTGDPPHTAPSAQQILVKIIAEEARPLGEARKSVPPNVAAVVAKALEKLPADRFETAKAFADALRDPNFTGPRVPAAGVEASGSRRARVTAVGASAVAVVATALALWGWLRPTPEPATERQPVILGVTSVAGAISFFAAVAPDGSAIVYPDSVGGRSLWIKERSEVDPRKLADIPGVAKPATPAFSPDGKWIAYLVDGRLDKVARAGGEPIQLSDSAAQSGVAWLDDGTIVFGSGRFAGRLLRTTEAGGPTTWVPGTDSVGSFNRLAPVPGADAVLASVTGGRKGPREIVVDLKSGRTHELVPGGEGAWIVPGGDIVYAQATGELFAAPFDRHRLSLDGAPVSILDHVTANPPVADVVLGADGTMLYRQGSGRPGSGSELFSVARDGSARVVDSTWTVSGGEDGMSLSPDGTRLAVAVSDSAGPSRTDVYILHLPNGSASRLTFGGKQNIRPSWSPDGRRVLYVSDAGGKGEMELWSRQADGSGEPVQVVSDERGAYEGLWSPDGKWIVYRTDSGLAGSGDILAVRTIGDSTRVPLVVTPAQEINPTLSPDGHWLAYVSDTSGRDEVYVIPFPTGWSAGHWQVSTDGGTEPAWSPDGKELFYLSARLWMVAAEITEAPTFSAGAPKPLFDARRYARVPFARTYAVSVDGRHFLMLEARSSSRSGRVVLVHNWLPELRAKLKGR